MCGNSGSYRAMREADLLAKPHTRISILEEHQRPRQVGSVLSQPVFDWKAPDRYVELLNFEMEVSNMLQAKVYDLNDKETVPIIKSWLSREGLQFIQTLTLCGERGMQKHSWTVQCFKRKIHSGHSTMK